MWFISPCALWPIVAFLQNQFMNLQLYCCIQLHIYYTDSTQKQNRKKNHVLPWRRAQHLFCPSLHSQDHTSSHNFDYLFFWSHHHFLDQKILKKKFKTWHFNDNHITLSLLEAYFQNTNKLSVFFFFTNLCTWISRIPYYRHG